MRENIMRNRNRPSGRDCALAQATLATLKESETPGRDALVAAAPAAIWREAQQRAIRLIDLERRARFARVAS
jgi:hypothetical protein